MIKLIIVIISQFLLLFQFFLYLTFQDEGFELLMLLLLIGPLGYMVIKLYTCSTNDLLPVSFI